MFLVKLYWVVRAYLVHALLLCKKNCSLRNMRLKNDRMSKLLKYLKIFAFSIVYNSINYILIRCKKEVVKWEPFLLYYFSGYQNGFLGMDSILSVIICTPTSNLSFITAEETTELC